MLTSLSCQPVPVRCKALRIKTSFNLGQHPVIPSTGQQWPLAGDRGGHQVGTTNEAEVKNVWFFVSGRGKPRPGLKKYPNQSICEHMRVQ